jgi:hypothetical protein
MNFQNACTNYSKKEIYWKGLLGLGLIFTILFSSKISFAQSLMDSIDVPISPATFKISSPLISPGTPAVVLFESISANLAYDYGWYVEYKIKKRTKILSSKGFDDYGKEVVYFSAEENSKSKLKDFSASTYNLENGVVVVSKVSKNDFLLENLDKGDRMAEKFAFPQVKEGSILEYSLTYRSYTISQLNDWEYQKDIPCLWGHMEISIPDFYNYSVFKKGNIPFYKSSQDSSTKALWVGSGTLNTKIIRTQWIVKNVAPFKSESFIYCPDDFRGQLNFQLYGYPDNEWHMKYIFHGWQDIVNRLLNSSHFGYQLDRANRWLLNPEIKSLLNDTSLNLSKAKSIYNYVQNQFTRSGTRFGAHQDLDDVYKNKKGNETEINFLLIALLRKSGFSAEPLVLSTRSNGKLNPNFPDLDKINYMIVRLAMGDHFYFLDASDKDLGFGKIPLFCYNGEGVVVKKNFFEVELNPDSINLVNLTSTYVTIGKDNQFIAQVQFYPDYYSSKLFREFSKKDSILPKNYLDNLKLLITPFVLDSIFLKDKENLDKPVKVEYNAHLPLDQDKLLYINPLLNTQYSKNPFINDDRQNPIQLRGIIKDAYIMDLEIPKGYKVEELPKSTMVSFNPEVYFRYLIKQEEDHIQIRFELNIHHAYFSASDYDRLRTFYDQILKKGNEFIVLKKI